MIFLHQYYMRILNSSSKHSLVIIFDILLQLKAESRYHEFPFSQKEFIEDTPTERLYSRILPTMTEYVIALLKVILASLPSSKVYTLQHIPPLPLIKSTNCSISTIDNIIKYQIVLRQKLMQSPFFRMFLLLRLIPMSRWKILILRFKYFFRVFSNSISLDLSNLKQNVLEEHIRIAIDINRHKEVFYC